MHSCGVYYLSATSGAIREFNQHVQQYLPPIPTHECNDFVFAILVVQYTVLRRLANDCLTLDSCSPLPHIGPLMDGFLCHTTQGQ